MITLGGLLERRKSLKKSQLNSRQLIEQKINKIKINRDYKKLKKSIHSLQEEIQLDTSSTLDDLPINEVLDTSSTLVDVPIDAVLGKITTIGNIKTIGNITYI